MTAILFGLSAWAIASEFRKYGAQEIFNNIRAIAPLSLLTAVGFTALNYLFLTGYDTLAVRYARHPLPYRKTALVAAISYAISNSVGMALLSGSAVRYRFYATWGLSTGKIAQIVAFCNVSFWIGLFAVGGLVFTLQPLSAPKLLHLPFDSVQPIGLLFLGGITAYLLLSALRQKPFRVGDWSLPHLPLRLSLAQIIITSCDWSLAAAVLYVLLPHQAVPSYFVFFSIYLTALLAGIISNVPGGLGVFETVLIMLLSPPLTSDTLLSALLVYRAIYYFLPLVLGVLLLLTYEVRHRLQRRSASRHRTAPVNPGHRVEN